MAYKSSRRLKQTLLGAVLASVACVAWADDPPIVRGTSPTPWYDGVHGGTYDFKMSAGTSKLYSFGVTPDAVYHNGTPTVPSAYGGSGPNYVMQPVQNFVYDGTTFKSKFSETKFGGKVLLYIHGTSVYVINPDLTFTSSVSADDSLVKTNFAKKLPLSRFTNLETADHVHMNASSMMWVKGPILYTGGNIKGGAAGGSQVLATDVAAYKSFGPFMFIQRTNNKVYFVGDSGQSRLVEVGGASNLSFLDSNATARMVDGETIQLLNINGVFNYRFTYTATGISNAPPATVTADDATEPVGGAVAAYSGPRLYTGANLPGGWVIDSNGEAQQTSSVYSTPANGVNPYFEYTCVDTPSWTFKNATFNDLDLLYTPHGAVAYSHLGGYGDMSVGMLPDGTLKFAGSGSPEQVMVNDQMTGRWAINGFRGWPYSNNSLGFCNPVSIPLEGVDGPSNVKATKGDHNGKIVVSWDAKPGAVQYTVKRFYAGGLGEFIVGSNITGTSFDDDAGGWGFNKDAYNTYAVSAGPATGIYRTRSGDIYFNTGDSFTGCTTMSALSTACAGFKANPVQAGSNVYATATAGGGMQLINTSGFAPTDYDLPYDTFTYTLGGAATAGNVTQDGTGKIWYTPDSGFVGLATFPVTITDKAGNEATGTVQIDVGCPAPVVNSVTVPSSFDSYISQQGTATVTSTGCSGTIGMDVRIRRQGEADPIASFSSDFNGLATGTNQAKNFFMVNMPAGNYTMTVEAFGERTDPEATCRSAGNSWHMCDDNAGWVGTGWETPTLEGQCIFKVTPNALGDGRRCLEVGQTYDFSANNRGTKTVNFTVNGVGTYTMGFAKQILSEDELVVANINGGTCALQTVANARANGKCYVDWVTHPLTGTTSTGPANLSGYAEIGNLQALSAKIYKFDTNLVAHEVATVNGEISVTPGTPTVLKPITVPAQTSLFFDNVNVKFERESGYDCTIHTSVSAATTAAAAGQKSCLIEGELPEGLSWMAGQPVPTLIGRFETAGTKTLNYTLSKYYSGKPKAVMFTDSLVFNAVEPAMTYSLLKNKEAFIANGTAAVLEAKIAPIVVGGKTCTPTTSVSAAKTSYSSASGLSCLVEWETMPAGLTPDLTVTVPKLKGMPTAIGNHPTKFNVYVVKPVGAAELTMKIGEYSEQIVVTDVTPMSYTMTTPKEGTIRLSGDVEPRILVGDDGIIGEVELTSGDFSTVKMSVQEYGFAPQVFPGMRNGEKKTISVSSGAKGAWINRQVSLKFEYEEVAVATQVTRTLELVQLPAQKMAIQIAQPGVAPNDTVPFSFTAKMGVPASGGSLTYSAASGGVWKAGLYVKQGLTMVPISVESTVQANGNVLWENLQYADYVGIDFYAKARYVEPDGSTSSVLAKEIVSDKSVRLNFVLGGALNGQTRVTRAKGVVPLKQNYDIELTTAQAASLKSVNWQISKDNTTWEYVGVLGRNAAHTVNEGGVYYVRGEMTNKYTNIVSYSEPATFTATQIYKLAFTGDDLFMPGTDAPLALSVQNYDGTAASTSNVDIVWDVDNSRGPSQSFTDVTNITLTSATPTTFNVSVRVKGKDMDAANPESWYELKKAVTFFTPASPRVGVVGPRMLEVGTSGDFIAQVKTPWATNVKTSLGLKGKWTLPDGVTEVPDVLTLAHLVRPEDGVQQKIWYTAWVDGLEAETSATFEYKYTTNTYVFPTFKLSVTVDSLFAPAYIKLGAIGSTAFDVQQMRGKNLTYTWTLPTTNFDGKASGYQMRGIADQPGTYNFEVVITDDRGNTQTLNHELVLVTTLPWELSFNLNPALKYNRNPMPFVVKPTLKGGHPVDRVLETFVSINGVEGPAIKGMPKQILVPTAGEHTIALRLVSVMGATVTATNTVTVNPNVPPACTMAVTWDKDKEAARLSPKCTDPDGKIRSFKWFVDGVESTRKSTYMVINTTVDKPSYEVKVEVGDDSGEVTELTTTINRGG